MKQLVFQLNIFWMKSKAVFFLVDDSSENEKAKCVNRNVVETITDH